MGRLVGSGPKRGGGEKKMGSLEHGGFPWGGDLRKSGLIFWSGVGLKEGFAELRVGRGNHSFGTVSKFLRSSLFLCWLWGF